MFGESMFLDIVAINYHGEPYMIGDRIKVISGKQSDIGKDDFGRHVFMNSIINNDYDLIFILQDLGIVVPMIPHLKKMKEDKRAENKKQFKSIFYFPVDCHLTPNLVSGLEFFDTLVTYTEYGRKAVLTLNEKVRPKLKVIPHGNSSNDFYPLSAAEINSFRKEYYGESNFTKLIIGCVNRNQPRKDIPTTILAFLEYWSEYNNDSLLYLHMNPKDPLGWHLRTILAQTPLVEGRDFMFPPDEELNKGTPVQRMNLIYNSFDCFLTTATGEGWGLTVTEAMACKIPVIAPKHTSINEINENSKNGLFMLETLYPVVSPVDNIIRFQTDIYEAAEMINTVRELRYDENIEYKNKVSRAYEYVKCLEWDVIAAKFKDEILRLV
jgi:glycosyltransferase involved in cell wall biosynthesis